MVALPYSIATSVRKKKYGGGVDLMSSEEEEEAEEEVNFDIEMDANIKKKKAKTV